MMQEGVDADGGYTVPEDIVTKIIELREARESLLEATTARISLLAVTRASSASHCWATAVMLLSLSKIVRSD